MSETVIYKKGGLTVKLVRSDKTGKMKSVKVEGKAELTEHEAVELQQAINKFTGHI